MSEASKKQLKRLIRKYEYLLEDWEEVDDINKTANMEMSSELYKHMPPDIKPSDFESEWDGDEEQEGPERDTVLKKLFRKIVVKCHPDRMPSDLSEVRTLELIDLYEKAVDAHQDQNWALMVIVAIKLEIDLPEEAEEKISEIEKDVKDLENKISSAVASIAWQWYHSEEEAREKLINNYLSILQKSKEVGPVEIKKTESKKGAKLILGVGHPRTGTGYTAKLLQSWGLDVGHEKMGEHGTVDWSLAAGEKSLWSGGGDFREWDWQHIIYCVRDPRESIASIAYTENTEISFEFRKKFERRIGDKSKIVSAIASILKWDQLITSKNPSIIYRIEDESKKLFNYLNKNIDVIKWSDSQVNVKYNQREHGTFKELLEIPGYIPNRFKRGINQYCEKYGYDKLF
jgi:hypothetical protein